MNKRHEFNADDYFEFILEMKIAAWTKREREYYSKCFYAGLNWGKFKPDPQFLRWLENRNKKLNGDGG